MSSENTLEQEELRLKLRTLYRNFRNDANLVNAKTTTEYAGNETAYQAALEAVDTKYVDEIMQLIQQQTDKDRIDEHLLIKKLTDEAHEYEQNENGSGIQFFDNARLERFKQLSPHSTNSNQASITPEVTPSDGKEGN